MLTRQQPAWRQLPQQRQGFFFPTCCVCRSAAPATHRRLTTDGEVVWSADWSEARSINGGASLGASSTVNAIRYIAEHDEIYTGLQGGTGSLEVNFGRWSPDDGSFGWQQNLDGGFLDMDLRQQTYLGNLYDNLYAAGNRIRRHTKLASSPTTYAEDSGGSFFGTFVSVRTNPTHIYACRTDAGGNITRFPIWDPSVGPAWAVDASAVMAGGALPTCLRLDASSNVYVAGRSGTKSVEVLDYDLNSTWSANHGAPCHAVAVDPDGNVWTGGETAFVPDPVNLRKYDSAGNLLLSVRCDPHVSGLACDSHGNVYATLRRNATVEGVTASLASWDTSGTFRWVFDHGHQLLSIDIDGSDRIFVGGFRGA